MRVLITGSRDWTDARAIRDRLDLYHGAHFLTVVHGACPTGADAIAAAWVAEQRGYAEAEPWPADWDAHPTKAGPIRNQAMVKAGADICLAYIKGRSKGATHTAGLALKAGIELHVWTAP